MKPVTLATPSPWLTSREAGAYLKRSYKFVLREIKAGRMRGARVGGKGEVLTRCEWLDEWVADHTQPLEIPRRRWS
jgi:excisionase family DNA binding protein